jgi:hypothetical protein
VFATGDDGRFGAFSEIFWNAFDVQHRERNRDILNEDGFANTSHLRNGV